MKKQNRIRTILLLLLVPAVLASCEKKEAPGAQGPVTGNWILYTENDTEIGTLSFRANDSVYFNEWCCSQSGTYSAVDEGRFRIRFAPRACLAVCVGWFLDEVSVTLQGKELLFSDKRQTLQLKARR